MSAAEQLNSKIIDEVRRILTVWGQWQRQIDGIGCGLSKAGYMERIGTPGQGPQVLPSNPEADQAEAIMCRIKRQQPPFYKVLKAIYYLEFTIRETSEELRVSEPTIKIWRKMGEAAFASYLDAGYGINK